MKGKIFNAQEVQAIIAGNKTMFREVIKNKTNFGDFLQTREAGDGWYKDRVISMRHKRGSWADYTLENFVEKFCPYQVGQEIFVKEAWGRKATGSGIAYKADNPNQLIYQHLAVKWNLPQHMKQEHSRLTLEITDIKVERLQSISQEDCAKEGIAFGMWQANGRFFSAPGEPIEIGFAKNWDATHKKPEEKFETNPFVWVVDFKINK